MAAARQEAHAGAAADAVPRRHGPVAGASRPALDAIVRAVAGHFGIDVADLESPERHLHVARPRQMALTIASNMTHLSLPEIGAALGGRDHTHVLHAVRTMQMLLAESPALAADYAAIVARLSSGRSRAHHSR